MRTREEILNEAFVQLTDTLVTDYEVIEAMQILVDTCAALFDGEAGLFLRNSAGEVEHLVASSDDVEAMELIQALRRQGPCVEAAQTGQDVVVTDLRDRAEEWPLLAAAARQFGVRSVAAIPLRLRGETIGSLNLMGSEPVEPSREDLAAARALADAATIGILHARVVADAEATRAQLEHALESRVVIEQAKGMIAERAGIPVGEAFQRLRAHARSHNRRLSDLAADVVSGYLAVPDIVDDSRR
jgi:GAF domain-containing protein